MLVTDFSDDYKALYRNDGDASFTEVGDEAGNHARWRCPLWDGATGFSTYDNDGWKDIMMINGHVYPQVDEHDWGTTFAERPLLFHNIAQRQIRIRSAGERSGLATLTSGRGAAFGDLFNNGKIDVVINPIDGPPVLLKNVNPDHHHWVELKLVGGPKEPARRDRGHGLSDRQRHAPARGRDQRRQLYLVERSAAALRPGRCDRRGNSGDPLALGSDGDGEAARRGPHLHDH